MNKIALTTVISNQQKQQLKLTPALKQSIEMIQMTSVELDQWLEQKLQDNPFLIEQDENQPNSDLSEEFSSDNLEQQTTEPSEDNFQIESDYVNNETEEWGSEWGDSYSDNVLDETNRQIVSPVSFQQEIELQLLGMPLSPELVEAAKFIIGNLNEDGLLPEGVAGLIDSVLRPPSLQDSINRSEVQALFEQALSIVKSLEPAGLGAADLTEFLCLQIERLENPSDVKALARRLLTQYSLKELARPNFEAFAKNSDTSIEKIKTALKLIKSLDPKSVARACLSEENQYVRIDLHSYKKNGLWFVILNRRNIKQVLFNTSYHNLIQKTEEKKQISMVQWHQEAKQILNQLQQRQSTLLKIGIEIAKKQQLFFEQGLRGLKPMVLRDIASAIEMNESTISRLVNGKFLQTLHGVFELKQLFSTGFSSEKNASQIDQEEVSSNTIKLLIQDFIRAEPHKKPYSDQKISEWLHKEHGLEVARRTVAKYRDLMGVPAASERKIAPES